MATTATAMAETRCTSQTSRLSYHKHATSSPLENASPLSSGWHFPGPSSRFNQRERAQTHSRAAITPSATPASHTERRAHRRAHSSYQVPTVAKHEQLDRAAVHRSLHARFTSPISPSSSEPVRSPLSRFSSFNTMAAENDGVVTPAKSRGGHSNLHDSPFSDYFTDDNRSIDEVAAQGLPALETQQLLVRLNKLQSTLMRGGNDPQALYLVGRRMSEIENGMDSLHSQSRQPPELEDSGLFMDEADEKEEDTADADLHKGKPIDTLDGAADDRPTLADQIREEEDSSVVLKQAYEVLSSVAKAHKELQLRFEEFKLLRAQYATSMREKDAELKVLRIEKQHMQQDLNLDHGDFVLLDGQLRLLENRVQEADIADSDLNSAIVAMRADCRKAIDKVNSKRVRYSECRTRNGEQYDEDLKLGSWKMNVVRNTTGRVDTMLLERLSVEGDPYFEISEVSAKVIERRAQVLYTDRAVQTASLQPASSTSSYCESEDDYDPRDELRQDAIDDDLLGSECAITTSASSEYGGDTNDNEDTNIDTKKKMTRPIPETSSAVSTRKSAWHELWIGMAELAGAGEHRW